MTSRTLIIGDLHGCFDEARDLLDRAAITSSDRVIFAGDLVDRGPFRRECVELAMQHECVLGNHEESHLQQAKRADDRLQPDHLATRKVLGEEHLAYFRTLPTMIRLPEHNAAVVHAGAMVGTPLDAQDPYHLLHIQCIRPPERKSYWPSKAPEGYRFWTQHWTGPERLIFGHTVVDKPLVTPYAVGIDTGCVYGHALTGLLLPSWELISVPARHTYRGGKGVLRYLIGDGVHAYS